MQQLPLAFAAPTEWSDAQWVALRRGTKIPIGPWRNHRPTYEVILDHSAEGGAVGIVPGTVGDCLRLAVLDVDGGDVWDLCRAYPPLAVNPTKRGHHVWYHAPGPGIGNGKWSGPGRTHGDVRGVNGYVRLWGDEVSRVDNGLAGVGAFPVPLHLVTSGGGRTGPEARKAAQQSVSASKRAGALLYRAMADASPVLTGATIGSRHATMVRRLATWGGRRTWRGATVDDYFIAVRAAAYWLGMPNRQTFTEREVVGILDWTIRMRPGWVRDRLHTEAWLLRQQARGRRGGLVSGHAERGSVKASASPAGSNEELQPWDADGVSRRTWYRRRAVGTRSQ